MSTKIQGYIEFFIIWGVVGGVIFSLSTALAAYQDNSLSDDYFGSGGLLPLIQGNDALIDTKSDIIEQKEQETAETVVIDSNTIKVVITGYSSTPEETDEDPFITASGDCVHDGIVAANFLPFGSKIRIPEIYGDEIFVVEDRMHPRKKQQIDIWFPSKQEALEFGARYSYIEVLEI
jgi:3D (Asp-Asp-Asp) domain-containing protein